MISKKQMVLISAAVLLVVAGAVTFGVLRSHNKPSHAVQAVQYKTINACDILTLSDARYLLGDAAKPGNQSGDVASDDINVSNCSYISGGVGATILVRSAKTSAGADSNKKVFSSIPPESTTVSGYGDSAYWSPTYGQLNILKGNNWFILTDGPADVSKKTLDGVRLMADRLAPKF